MFKVSTRLALIIWLRTNLVLSILAAIVFIFSGAIDMIVFLLLFILAGLAGSIPVLVLLALVFPFIRRFKISTHHKRLRLYAIIFLLLCGYGFAAALFNLGVFSNFNADYSRFLITWGSVTGILSFVSLVAIAFSHQAITNYLHQHQTNTIMEQSNDYTPQAEPVKTSNTILYKGIITGVLILLMMIPALFINSLVQERKMRQQQVVEEVSSKWAIGQVIGGFYLSVPYEEQGKDEKGKPVIYEKQLIVLPENLQVSSVLFPEIRPRSIYKVLLYRSNLQYNGNYAINLPATIKPEAVKWAAAKICLGLTDIKGIEEKVVVSLADQSIELSPGLPNKTISETGLSATVDLTNLAAAKTPFSFSSTLKLKGSEKLHFIPLAGNSKYAIKSSWRSPSFDGNYLPGERNINDSGFNSSWSFNKANLPFGTLLQDVELTTEKFAFGVTMVQPSDQYAKTERSVKYAILFIGLTFSLFFIIELMQKNPVHPVQYVLIGVALSIFYTLLLSISEFIAFDLAYLIAAVATILLITLYAKGHFRSWKTGALFGSILSVLYGFTFVLVRLEDTALLIGSIGLFIVLALVMYASRKINWYGTANYSA
jgi:inner membrane protein